MKSDNAALPAFLAKTGAASASTSSVGARKESNGGDDFASVMRKSESAGNSDKLVSRNEDAARVLLDALMAAEADSRAEAKKQ